jgi:hypothetical protein
MATPEHDEFGLYASQASDDARRRRRKQVAGVAGLAVLVGGAVLLATGQMGGDHTTIRDTGALAPVVPATSPTPSPTDGAVTAGPTPTKAVVSSASPKRGAPSPTKSLTARQKIDKARAAMAKDGVAVQRPLAPVARMDSAAVTETTVGSAADGGTVKISSARGDLTGYAEMAWAADKGQPVGSARCTHKFRFAQGAPGATKPTMLLCWRTSATRSVYTLAVSPSGKPKAATSVAAIDAQWAKLG